MSDDSDLLVTVSINSCYRLPPGSPSPGVNFNKDLYIPESKITIDFDEILGKGAMGTVFAAKTNNRFVAIKIPIQKNSDYFEDFSHELKIASMLRGHSTICAAHSWTVYREIPCLIFEKMEGNLLTFVRNCDDEIFPPNKLFLQYLWQISDALMFVASKQLVHR